MYELWTTDLRPDLANVHVPVLAIHTWIGYKQYGATHESVQAMVKPQYANLKDITVRISDRARHFVMLDDPTWFFAQLDAFLTSKT